MPSLSSLGRDDWCLMVLPFGVAGCDCDMIGAREIFEGVKMRMPV
jgi:hypothetical protein